MPLLLSIRAILRPAIQASGQATGWLLYNGLTPTIYAASAAQGTGSGNSEANAMSLASALSSAVAGDVVGILPGTCTGSNTASRFVPSFNPANSGTVGNPIRLVAKYSAAYYESNRTTLSNGVTSGESGCPTFGASTRNYIHWIGVHVDVDSSRPRPDTGPSTIHDCTGSEIHQAVIVGAAMAWVDNYNAVRVEDCTDPVVKNCKLSGIRRIGGNTTHNVCAIMLYGARNAQILNNEITDCNVGVWAKGGGGPGDAWGNYGVCRYNKIWNVYDGVLGTTIEAGEQWLVEHNLIYDFYRAALVWDDSVVGTPNRNVRMRNNTGYTTRTGIAGGIWIENVTNGGASPTSGHECDDNIIVIPASTDQVVNAGTYTGGAFTSFDGNCLYQSGGTRRFSVNGSNYTSLGDFQSAFPATNNVESDPMFVDVGGGDFRLQGGSPAAGKGCYVTGNEQIGVEI